MPDRLENHTKAPNLGARRRFALFLTSFSHLASTNEMRGILISILKILISAVLLYFSLRKIDLDLFLSAWRPIPQKLRLRPTLNRVNSALLEAQQAFAVTTFFDRITPGFKLV